MGILGNVTDGVVGSVDNILSTIKNPFASKTPVRLGPDFAEGFIIQEFIDGRAGERLVLQGNMLPKQPFSFGGEQKIVKDYYPGNSEPVTQVLGPRESDTVIKGLFKAKQFESNGSKIGGLYGAPEAFQRQVDAFRVRGNICQFTLGTWERWGYISKTHFEMDTLARIAYEITLDIIGFKRPSNGKFVDHTKEIPFAINKDLILQASFIKESTNPPMPKSISGVLNGYISDVASGIAVLTNFVDTTLKTAEDINGSLNRALGLVKNARASISIFRRRVKAIKLDIATLGATPTNGSLSLSQQRAQTTASSLRNASFILNTVSSMNQISAILAKMQAQFEALIETTPQARYLVKQGDTLQKIASKYFDDADQWKLIYDHNKLTSTSLAQGSILEIPKRKGTPASIDPSSASAPTSGAPHL